MNEDRPAPGGDKLYGEQEIRKSASANRGWAWELEPRIKTGYVKSEELKSAGGTRGQIYAGD
jgi:hypothetical protein